MLIQEPLITDISSIGDRTHLEIKVLSTKA